MNRGAALLLALALCAPARAADLFVDQVSGSDVNDGLTWATARATVASAVATAAASPVPDVISVAAGRYLDEIVVPADTTLLGGFPTGGGTRDPSASVTTLDGGGTVAPVVHFPPGSDRTVLDGFTVRGGLGSNMSEGGGILVRDAAPLLRGNLIEENSACYGSGLALVYTSARPAALVQENVIVRNVGPWECDRGIRSEGGGVFLSAPPGVDLGVVLSSNFILENGAARGGGVYFEGQGAMQHDVIERNGSGLDLVGGPITVFNAAIIDNRSGIALSCGGTYVLDNVTIAGSDYGGIRTQGLGATDLRVENAILWNGGPEVEWTFCSLPEPVILSSIVQGGYPGGIDIIDADPLFVPGPLGDYYLSQTAAGQAITSPAVDAGSVLAMTAGLDQRTTATDSTPDTGTVDLGYHAPRVPSLTLLRGTAPDALTPHRTITSLPFLDDPGTLSDPALPLLFYQIPEAENEIGVEKDLVTDAVKLVFLGSP